MSDPREIIHRGRRYVVRTSTVGGQVYYHVCPYSGHNPFAKDVMYICNEGIARQIMELLDVMYICNEGIARQIMELLELDAQGGRLFEHPTEPTGEWDWI